jgi:hypothetical protein
VDSRNDGAWGFLFSVYCSSPHRLALAYVSPECLLLVMVISANISVNTMVDGWWGIQRRES